MSRPAAEFRSLRDGDIEALVANMRPADRAECEALVGPDVEGAVRRGCAASVLLWTVEAGGEVVAILGLVPRSLMGGDGVPWMLGTSLVDVHRRALNRVAPSYIAQMLATCPRLFNVVDVRNTRSIRWLRSMGFVILPPVPCGVAGLPFHPFVMEAPDV